MRPLFLVVLIASISLAYMACGSPTPTQETGQEPASETITDASIESTPDASEKAPESPAVEQGPEVTAQNCEMGKFYPCYSGDPALAGKGICRTGSRECLGDGKWGACNGAVGPGRETDECDGKDNDCDGEVDEGCSLPPGKPRIVEVMATPQNGDNWFIEVQNISKDQDLDPCTIQVSGGEAQSPHDLVPLKGDACLKVKPGGYLVIAEGLGANVASAPATTVLMKPKGGSFYPKGNFGAGRFKLYYKGKVFDDVGPTSGAWPRDGKAAVRCDSGDWKEADKGTPGAPSPGLCP